MNIFVLDYDIEKSVIAHCDRHVVKMIVEYAQLLSAAHRILDGNLSVDLKRGRRIKVWNFSKEQEYKSIMYSATHINHPAAIWARENSSNYMWLLTQWKLLCKEYTYRYGKIHKTESLSEVLSSCPRNMSNGEMTPFVQCIPDKYREKDAVQAYRKYYRCDKAHLLKFKNRDVPAWI